MRALIVLAVLLAGCAAPDVAPDAAAACVAPLASLSGGGCAAVVGDPALRDREVSLAVHPSLADTALITWRQGEFSEGPRVLAAHTRGGGATWTSTMLEHRGQDPPVRDGTYAYDSIAAFGSDGTAYVLYGGDRSEVNDQLGIAPFDRLTLARSADGATWTYATVYEPPSRAASPDYPDLAVSTDGRLYVVAQMLGAMGLAREGIWLWASDDGGATWSGPNVIIPYAPAGIGVMHYLPRVSAGGDGLVVVTTNGPGEDFAAYVTVSTDGGDTFAAPRKMLVYGPDAGGINDPSAVDGSSIALVYADGARLVGFRSEDAGATWSEATELGTLNATASYAAVASAPGGAALMARHGGEAEFAVSYLRWTGESILRQLHRSADDGRWVVGDDYGAIGVAADGTAWVAWAQPAGESGEDVWITRLP